MRYFILITFLISYLYSNPKGEKIKYGNVDIKHGNKIVEINQISDRAIIEWQDFSIKENEVTKIQAKLKDSVILNRIIGNLPSNILGKLDSNAKIYLINQNGILISENAVINSKSFIGSTYEVTNEDFLFNKEKKFICKSQNGIENRGKIISDEEVCLIAKTIKNEGLISANSKVILAAKNHIYLFDDFKSPIAIRVKKDQISKIDKENVYAFAINQNGIIHSNGAVKKGGKIILTSDDKIVISNELKAKSEIESKIHIFANDITINKNAKIDVSGDSKKEILIGGDFQGQNKKITNAKKLFIGKNVEILANGDQLTAGGKVILWADDKNHFLGNISAKGGQVKGNGGFVEISSKKDLKFEGQVITTAKNGLVGTLLLDPSDIQIGDFNDISTPTFPTAPPGEYDPTVEIAYLDYRHLQTALASNDVTVSTSAGVGGEGRIFVIHDIAWNAPNKLTLLADKFITIKKSTITNNYTGGGNWTAIDFKANENGLTSGNFASLKIIRSTITSAEGHINLVGRGGNVSKQNYGIHLMQVSNIYSTGQGVNSALITLQGTGGNGSDGNTGIFLEGSEISSVDGNINFIGSTNGSGMHNHGIFCRYSEIESSGTTSNAAQITLNGEGAGTFYNNGIKIMETAKLLSGYGDINLTGNCTATGDYNKGICCEIGYIESTGNGTDAAKITLNGDVIGGDFVNNGIYLVLASNISSIDGDIVFNATSIGNIKSNFGIYMQTESEVNSSGADVNAADITLTSSATGALYDMYISQDSEVTADAGNITYNGTKN